jgi:diguanylate cyclase (GGDEF)-like protein/PAS domain S-box-containing protein
MTSRPASRGWRGRRQRQPITNQSRASIRRDTERRFASLMAGSSDPVTVLDRDARVTFHGASMERLLGWSADQMLNKQFSEFLDPHSAAGLPQLIERAEAHPEERRAVHWQVRKSDDTMLDVEAVLAGRFGDPDICGVIVNIRDIGERLALEEALRQGVVHDGLTGLPNRILFEDRLMNALDRTARSGQIVCLLLADLDDFKDVNDSFGHGMGDQLLLGVSRRLDSCLRPHDTLARVGGDAFAILVEVEDERAGAAVAERVVAALAEPIALVGVEVFAHASIGIATGSGVAKGRADRRSAEQLMVEAYLAKHQAKQWARGQFRFFTPAMQVGVMEHMAMRSDLERGLSRDEFTVFYQPIVALESGRLVGAEALVRWRHPERGLVPPAEFIPTTERTGLIRELGHWVMKQACAEAVSWPAPLDGGAAPYVSVNVAGPQLQQPGFVAEVAATLAEAGLDPNRLVIEVTESILIEGDNEAKLSELQQSGIILAVDDFGTGYSSLSYLRRFNMDVLKIDKSFIDHVGTDSKDSALAAAMVAMGNSLGMTVVAEGIERPEQLGALGDLDCAFGQGYLFSKPVEPTELRAIFDRRELPTPKK